MASTTEQRELELVDKVNLRILNVANNGPKLSALLKTFLAPILLKAGSEHASVRQKVVLIASRLKTFIQSPDVVLPVATLLDQYIKNPHPVIRQLDIGFAQHSIERIAADERRALIKVLVAGIAADSGHTAGARFNLLLHALKDVTVPPRGSKEDEGFRADLGFDGAGAGAEAAAAAARDAAFVAAKLGQLLLLVVAEGKRSPGLNEAEVAFLTLGKPAETWTASSSSSSPSSASPGLDLPATRIRAAKLLESGAFTDDERFLPAVYAASSSDYRINGVGEAILMRNKASLEEEARVRALFERHAQLPAPYRIRILNLLTKSAEATSAKFTKNILAVVRRDIGGTGSATDEPTPDGLQLTKIHRALFEFIHWVARIGPGRGEFTIGPELIEMLRNFITQEQGWPRPKAERRSTNPLDDQVLRARAYETVGVLAKGSVMEESKLLHLVAWLFRSLAEDPTPEVVVNIEGALSSMASSFQSGSSEAGGQLRTILLTYMTLHEGGDVVRSVRHAATKWANQCLPFADPVARWVDILAIAGRADERTEVAEEGHKGLDPWTYRVNDENITTQLPDWQSLVQTFFNETIGFGSAMQVDGPQALQNFTGLADSAFPTAVTYCKRILFLAALKDEFKLEPGWERQLETLVQTDKQTRDTIRHYLASQPGSAALKDLLEAAFEGIQEDKAMTEACARVFVEVASLCPRAVLASPAVNGLGRLLLVLKSNKKEVRVLAARALGILGAHPAVPLDLFNTVHHILLARCGTWRTAVGAEMNAAEGAFLALGSLWSRGRYYPHQFVHSLLTPEKSDEGEAGAGGAVSSFQCHQPPSKRRKTDAADEAQVKDGPSEKADAASAIQSLRDTFLKGQEAPDTTTTKPGQWLPPIEELKSASASLQDTVFTTMAQLWTASIVAKDGSIESYIDLLAPLCKKGNERAITALGRLTIGRDDDDADVDTVLSKLYELHELRQAEVHFSIGEAITATVARWDSDIVQLTVDVESCTDDYRVGKRTHKIKEVLHKILTDCKATKPSLLKASGIWLFCIIQHCAHLPEIQSRLRECQVAFMRLLSARDELVQETASRGLALVYEKGDPALKEDLVKDLVGAFTGSGTQLKVEEETELFEAGALPTGEGKSVTSYKDIVNLANEVGDQTLVYKFMSLASNAATWSTRSAFGRFGLSNILSESEVDPKLYPKLYRYRFDPNPNVQRSMNDIWKALVKDSNAVVEAHFDAIITDLLKSIHGKEWRVRQASCAAVTDLISGRPFQQYEKYYAEIWTKALKVLDDVKASVRESAMRLCMGMANTLTRQLEEGGVSASAKDMMSSTLPFLLSDNGIESSVDEVKGFAITTVITITKTGGKALRPYIATIVTHMLGLLSTIEPDAVNYYYQRFGDDDRGKLDKMRSQMVGQSPIFQAIENCLRNVDAETMPALTKGIEETIKSAIGMPTKVGCARILGTLATRHTSDFQPYAARFLQVLEKQCLDRNDEVSNGYARAAAYIMRQAPGAAKERFVERFLGLYFSAEDEARREKCAAVVVSLSKISPDHFVALEGSLLPFAFFGMHDGDEYVAKAFQKEVWDVHAGSSERAVTRFVPEIVKLVERGLDAPQWGLKHAAALAVGDAVKAVVAQGGMMGGRVDRKQMGALWPAFDKGLALKTFPGKEKLLVALEDLHVKGKVFWMAGGGGSSEEQEEQEEEEKTKKEKAAIAAQLKKIVLREAKRNNDAYRVHAFKCLGECAGAREDLPGRGLWDDVVGIVKPFLENYAGGAGAGEDEDQGNKMDIDSGAGADGAKAQQAAREKELLVYKTVVNGTKAIARGYSRRRMRECAEGNEGESGPVLVLGEIGSVLMPFLKPAGEHGSAGASLAANMRLRKFDSVRREVWYDCVRELMEEVGKVVGDAGEDGSGHDKPEKTTEKDQGQDKAKVNQVLLQYLDSLDVDQPDVGVEAHRLARAKAVLALVRAGKGLGTFGDGEGKVVETKVQEVLDAAITGERAVDVLRVLKEAREGI
ncbi:proteasome stabiliser-domain-containing protein [Coniella lustricola]|uniref:Proteasome stabiliser-domain-containing protein n=1 Tax=Coniella lustricola TaxID=2025994 RepID=A0A2T2ZV38_9PEZI|nr:proteasome stabiliser-domain-containing protein [Coniella lustricola]